jgi:hypothetical protein
VHVTDESEREPERASIRGNAKRAIFGLSVGVALGAIVVAASMTVLVLLVLWYLESHGT